MISELSFGNQLATLELDGRAAHLSLERAIADEPFLVPTLERKLAAAPSSAEPGLAREAVSPS